MLPSRRVKNFFKRHWPGRSAWIAGAVAFIPARQPFGSRLAFWVIVLGLSAASANGEPSPCIQHSFEYRSCSASRTWCGFDTFTTSTPRTKYRTLSQQDTAGGYTWSGTLCGNGAAGGKGLYHSATGQITFSGTGNTCGIGTNWNFECRFGIDWPASINYASPGDQVFYKDRGTVPASVQQFVSAGASASIVYVPATMGSQTISCTTNCTWTTNTTPPFVLDSALVLQSRTATTEAYANASLWTTATRTRTLSLEYKREAVEQSIIAEDLADCPAGGWKPAAVAATSTLIGNSVTVTKVGYQIKIPRTERGTTYLLSWKVLVYDSTGNLAGEETAEAALQGTGDEITTGEIILLPPLNVGGSRMVDKSSLVIKTVNGGGDCCNGAVAAGQGAARLKSVEVEFGLGKGRFGLGGGQLYIKQEALDDSSARPAALKFAGDPDQFEVLNDAGGIRQVLGAQALADVVATNDYCYDIRFYAVTNVGAKVGGFYPVSNTPHTVWTVRNPDGASFTNRLQVVETRGSKAITNEYQWSATNHTWTFIAGNGLRTETKTVTWDAARKLRSEIRQTYSGSGELVYQEVKKFQAYAFGAGNEAMGMALSETRIGLPGAEVTTTNTYVNSTTAPRLDTVTRSDGSWDAYLYDAQGRVLVNYSSSFSNQAPTKSQSVSSFSYHDYAVLADSGDDGSATNSEARTVYHSFMGLPVSRHFLVRRPGERIEGVGQNESVTWNTAGNLLTTNRFYTNGAFGGYPLSSYRPDGTASVYFYETNASLKITTMLNGQPDPVNPTNILEGTKTVTFVGLAGQTFSNVVCALPQTNVILAREIYSDFDELFRPGRTTYLDGTFQLFSYDCCGLAYEIERDGSRTDYTYDDLKRLVTSTRNGITTIYAYDGFGRVLAVARQGTDGSTIVVESSGYDTAGRLLARTNALGAITTFSETIVSNQTVRVTTRPDRSTVTNLYARDGSLLEVTGSAAQPVRYQYGILDGIERRRFVVELQLDASGGTNEWVKTYTDPVGRVFKREFAAAAGTPSAMSYFNHQGQLTNSLDPDGISTIFAYNGKAELAYSVLNSNRNATIDFSGPDRITYVTNDIIHNGVADVRRTRTFVWSNSANASNLVSSAEVSTDGLRSWHTLWHDGAPVTSQSRVVYDAANGYRFTTNIAPDNSYSVAIMRYGTNVSLASYDSTGMQLGKTTYGYDAHGRRNTVTDARTGTTTYTYNAADQVTSVTTPDPDGAGPGPAQTTTVDYDNMGRVWKTTFPDNTSVTNEYHPTGQLKKTYGSRTYPVEYTYDPQGRLKTMKTWQDFAGGKGAATTTWNYDRYRGWLTNKTYEGGGAGPVYTYTAAGRLATRTWARGTNTTYSYNWAGDLVRVDYSDGTPDLGYGYDRLGRQVAVTNDTTLACTYAYNDLGQLLAETWSGGPWSGLAVTNGYDSLMRRSAVALDSQPSSLVQYGYDTASRLAAVTNGSSTVAYGYLANSPLLHTITFKESGSTRLTTTKSYDHLNRLTFLSSAPSADAAVSFNYQLNSSNQRTAITHADSSRWVYAYDHLGQVVSGRKYWSDGTLVAGQQFEYTFDDIGNRRSTAAGGDQNGANLRGAVYTNNLLNQLTRRDVPGYVDIQGSATNTATVTVNNQPSYRHGDYFRVELSVTNAGVPVFLAVTNLAVLKNGATADLVSSVTGKVFVAQSPEASSYDNDGNLTSDCRWTVTWDAENRATSFTRVSNSASGANIRIDCEYDGAFRRVQKIVSGGDGSDNEVQRTNLFIYDGWNLVAVLNHTNGLLYSFAWGLDASLTEQGAGGVGGLVAMTVHVGLNAGTYFYTYDGNGNVATLVSVASGAIAAHYEYGPFGELLRATGPMALENPFLFSTKYYDWETGFCYYGYRYYDPSTGRWLGRDPLEEPGGANLFAFVGNDPLNAIDVNGLALYAFDGTNNDRDRDRMDNPKAANGPSNVGILYGIYQGRFRYYLNGVGTRESSGIKNMLGNAGGYGGKRRIAEMLKGVEESLAGGDDIADVIGFSRGAAMARDFVNQLNRKYPCVKVRWLGLFDTVGSFGIGGNDADIGYELGIPSNVERAFHMVAGDESRYFFPLASIWRGPHARPSNRNYQEITLRGAHSDIGGGYRDHRGLANAALQRMHKDGMFHKVPFGPVPEAYLNTKDEVIHDSRWLNDKAGPIINIPLWGMAPNPFWSAERTVYYHP